ncbi:Osteoclast-associated immunoglobulin-like receptor, partial [Clarias magur]
MQDLLPKGAADHEEGHDARLGMLEFGSISFRQMELLRLMNLPNGYDRVEFDPLQCWFYRVSLAVAMDSVHALQAHWTSMFMGTTPHVSAAFQCAIIQLMRRVFLVKRYESPQIMFLEKDYSQSNSVRVGLTGQLPALHSKESPRAQSPRLRPQLCSKTYCLLSNLLSYEMAKSYPVPCHVCIHYPLVCL